MSLLLDLMIRSSAVLLAGLTLEAVLAGRSAALRHCVLAATVLAAAAVVPLSVALPAWEISWPAPLQAADPPAIDLSAVAADRPSPSRPIERHHPASSLVAAVWAAGFIMGAAVLLTGMARLMRVGARAARVPEGRWTSIVTKVAAAYGLRREVLVLQTDAPDLLATWGVLRPRVLLPSHAREWSDDRMHAVMCHELAHIRRHDWLVQMSVEWLRTVCWFNPLMWIVCTHLRRDSEQACDDAVLERGVPAREYARHLLELARRCRRPGSAWASAVPMARPSTLERRIAAMLNPGLNRKALSRRAIATIAVLLLGVTLPTSALRAGQSAPALLSGSVYDPSGAVLPGVELTLEDANQIAWQATTDGAGHFEFTRVPPGRYVVSASLAGFRPLRHEFELRNSRDWDRAVTLQVGDLRETVTVSARRVAASRPPAQTQAVQQIRVGGNIRPPRKEYHARPTYPPSMRDAGREGIVPMEATIGRDGTVTFVRILSAQVHPDFAAAAVEAVRQWRFSPTLLNDLPVEVVMTVSVEFRLSE